MNTHSKDYSEKQTELDTASLLRLLQEAALERVPFAVNLQLTYSNKGRKSAIWLWKNQIEEQL